MAPINNFTFVKEGGKTVKHMQRTDLNEPRVGWVIVKNDWMEVSFDIPVWRQDQLESLKRAFAECLFHHKAKWVWTSSFAIYIPSGQGLRRGCNTDFVMDNITWGAQFIVVFEKMPKHNTVRPDSLPTWPPVHRIDNVAQRYGGGAPAAGSHVAKRPAGKVDNVGEE